MKNKELTNKDYRQQIKYNTKKLIKDQEVQTT